MIQILYVFTFLHGVFAAGVIPILSSYLPGHTTPAFAAYFAGLVGGQLLVVAWAALRERPRAYAVSEVLFGATLLFMAATLAPWSLIVGRLLEGLAAGIALPLRFELVARLGGHSGIPRRLALFNSVFAIGFVAGPPLVELLLAHVSAAGILSIAGALCVLLALAALPFLASPPPPPVLPSAPSSWFGTFFLVFLAKATYGFVLPFTTDRIAPRLAPLSLAQVMLLLSAASIVGQAAGAMFSRRVSNVVFPTILAVLMLSLYATGWPYLLFPAAVAHALVLHAGLLEATGQPRGARDVALISSLSDPGMILGAALAATGWTGLVGIAVLCLVPLIRHSRRV